ncbi:hypothetical protein OROGR_004578 [Orobanche gracilis]
MNIIVSILVFLSALEKCSFALSVQMIVTLLEVKTSLNDTRNFLSDWKEADETPCQWTGVACSPQDQRVIKINLPYMQFEGIISPSISKLNRLQRLALHQNMLHGFIPSEIGGFSELRALYFRGNDFEGGIPSNIGNRTQLTILNLSTNFLSGEIPHVGALNRFGYTSFNGNLELCGQQVDKPCRTSLGFPVVLPHAESDEAIEHKRSSHYIKGLVIGAMAMLGFAVILLLGFLWIKLLRKKERAAKKYTQVKKQVLQEPIQLN